MTVGIFEIEHFEGSYPVIRLFDNGENTITIFTNRDTYRQFQFLFGDGAGRYQWVVQGENESRHQFIVRMYREVRRRKITLLYLNTISSNFLEYACLVLMLRNTRKVITLHAVNTFFRFKPAFSLRRWVRHIGKRALISVTREFNVVSETMVDHLKQLLPVYKKVYNVPGAVFESGSCRQTMPTIKEEIVLVVPGTVDIRRRDYDIVFQLLEKATHLPLKVVLLGSFAQPYGKTIREKCLAAATVHPNLYCYDLAVVDQPEFDRVMNEAHFAFTPTVIDTVMVDDIPETYGKSICSGNVFDIIKHAKPYIVPTALTMPHNLHTSAIRYSDVTDIVRALEIIHREPGQYQQMLDRARLNSEQYTIENVRRKNEGLFYPTR